MADNSIDLSIVVPIYNEEVNIAPLCDAIRAAMNPTGRRYEILLVNDGSTDRTPERISEQTKKDDRVVVVNHNVNLGQARALTTGFAKAAAPLVVSLDADLQNDPADIPLLIESLDNGADVACGWRRDRLDPFWGKVLPSRIFNAVLRVLFKLPIHDTGSTLRVYRAEAVRGLELEFDEISFIPVILHLKGFKIVERIIRHHPRARGQAKYNSASRYGYTIRRLWRLWRFARRGVEPNR
jgi:glycosyltransferase involved in cell wall biosynthesis